MSPHSGRSNTRSPKKKHESSRGKYATKYGKRVASPPTVVLPKTPGEEKALAVVLSDISLKVDTCIRQNNVILKAVKPGLKLKTPDILPTSPFKTVEDFTKFEEKLVDSAIATEVSDYLAAISSGVKAEHRVIAMLERLLSNNAASQMSWLGSKRQKLAFRNTKAKECLICAVHCADRNADISKIEESMKAWLQHAPGRLKSEQAQSNKKNKDQQEVHDTLSNGEDIFSVHEICSREHISHILNVMQRGITLESDP